MYHNNAKEWSLGVLSYVTAWSKTWRRQQPNNMIWCSGFKPITHTLNPTHLALWKSIPLGIFSMFIPTSVTTAASRNMSTTNSKKSPFLPTKPKHSICMPSNTMTKHSTKCSSPIWNLHHLSWTWKWQRQSQNQNHWNQKQCQTHCFTQGNALVNHQTQPQHQTPIKFIPTGIACTVGSDTYINMICNNNQFLDSATMILVYGFTSKTLELKITTFDPHTQTMVHHSIHNILLETLWCHGIEPTQAVRKFLFVTTKAHLHKGCQWLDNNLPPLFANYISKHPNFVPNIDHPIAKHADYQPQSQTLETYANTPKWTTPTILNTKSKQAKQFSRLPKAYTSSTWLLHWP